MGSGIRECLLPVVQWGRTLWPLRQIKAREAAAAVALLERIPCSGQWMVDLGCGAGTTLAAARPERCIGIDRSQIMLRRAVRQMRLLPVRADATAVPLPSGRFSFVLAVGVAEYCMDPEPLLSEAARLLTESGWFLFTVSPPGCFTSFRRMTALPVYIHRDEALSELFSKCHFRVIARSTSATQKLFLLQKSESESQPPKRS